MYTSSRSPRHYFVKEVVVGLNNINLPQNIVLVDTPGLNDIVSYRSNITKQYIERANAVIVCINAENFDTNALQTLYGVFGNVGSHVEKVITLGTKIDIFHTPLESWEKHKANWIKYLSSADCYGSIELAKQNIMHVSAKPCVLLHKYNELSAIAGSLEESYDPTNLNAGLSPALSAQREDTAWEISALLTKWKILFNQTMDPHKTMCMDGCSIYDFVMRFSNIPMLLQVIDERLVKRYKELLIEELSEQYSIIRNEISDTMRKICSEKELIIRSSEAGIHEIISKREDYAKLINDAKSDEKELPKILKTSSSRFKQIGMICKQHSAVFAAVMLEEVRLWVFLTGSKAASRILYPQSVIKLKR
jgi:hypothetical protein